MGGVNGLMYKGGEEKVISPKGTSLLIPFSKQRWREDGGKDCYLCPRNGIVAQ